MKMRPLPLPKLGLGFLLASAFVLSACGGDPNDAAPKVEPSPLVFEITNAQGETEGWMLGTIHALPKDTEWRTPFIDNVIDEAD
ncbi:MAG: TraB/GumN family protein, partial [Pseudomonadota bacterium]